MAVEPVRPSGRLSLQIAAVLGAAG